MREIELYKLLATEDNEYETVLVDELGWVSDDEFLVWVSYPRIKYFIRSLKELFNSLFDDGGFEGNFQDDSVCLNLSEILDGYDIDLKKLFPIDRYKH